MAGYIGCFPALEMLVLGAKTQIFSWKGPFRQVNLGKIFAGLQLPKLKVLWLRGWTLEVEDLLSLKAVGLQWIVLEQCKGMNGGWIKAIMGRWKGIIVVESAERLNDGVDFRGYRGLVKGNEC